MTLEGPVELQSPEGRARGVRRGDAPVEAGPQGRRAVSGEGGASGRRKGKEVGALLGPQRTRLARAEPPALLCTLNQMTRIWARTHVFCKATQVIPIDPASTNPCTAGWKTRI